jgi:hypothetical protein
MLHRRCPSHVRPSGCSARPVDPSPWHTEYMIYSKKERAILSPFASVASVAVFPTSTPRLPPAPGPASLHRPVAPTPLLCGCHATPNTTPASCARPTAAPAPVPCACPTAPAATPAPLPVPHDDADSARRNVGPWHGSHPASPPATVAERLHPNTDDGGGHTGIRCIL